MNRPAALVAALTMAAALAGCAGAPRAEGGKPAAFAGASHKASPYLPMKVPGHAMFYYGAVGGVDELSVRLTASGNLIRLSYRVIDPAVAKVLADKNITPYLFGPRSGALLQVPAMDTVGQLRQVGQLEPGRSYWMVFSNKGNLIKPGDRVSVLAGAMHIDGLMVE
ncbi:hypothetical protein [Ralstonia solanacearum]|uniref:Transmembrane protein n=1 Tax=Ralstonia solanacearum TaxID=305 RepID=A0AAE3NJA2_RALSL|nr:hypothetical protein [Ralstonia solanacearum]MBB6581486.1 hypothetical protein [Ralstonia solanacearum]MDB0521481.1 hypothetical protein [Ralstonia solanacearum]